MDGRSNGRHSNGILHGDVKAKQHKTDDVVFVKELARLQIEFVKLQAWVKHWGPKFVVLLEGCDAPGKGGVIMRITERMSPRTPTELPPHRAAPEYGVRPCMENQTFVPEIS